jgi:hypothetical protein
MALVLSSLAIDHGSGAPPAPRGSVDIGKVAAEAVSQRLMNETKARLLDPNLDDVDVRLLSDDELDGAPVTLNPTDRTFPRAPSAKFTRKELAPGSAGPRYVYSIKTSDVPFRTVQAELRVDSSLAPPTIDVDVSDPLHPRVRVPRRPGSDGHEALYYFEFDTSPRFDSPNFWQYPTLKPAFLLNPSESTKEQFADLTGRGGIPLEIFASTQRHVDGRTNEARFAFRASAMRLPGQWSALSFDELERQALAVAYGLPPAEMIAEVYRYGRDIYWWGWDTIPRSPIEVFRAGIAECSANNNLIGAMLEMNGVRYRIVEGFNPRVRVFVPKGGHSAIEVFDPGAQRWSYLDSYLDLYVPGVSAQQLAAQAVPASQIPVSRIVRPHHQAVLGETLILGPLFKFRRYGDNLSRLPMISMLRLRYDVGEDEYGTGWRLNTVTPRPLSELFPERQTIYVRARYVLGGAAAVAALGEPPVLVSPSALPVASPWGTARFEISPRALMARYPTPQVAAPPNVCKERPEAAVTLRGPFKRELGHAYLVELRGVEAGDGPAAPKHSTIQLCENDRPLGPAHAVHDEIRGKGRGRYSHWGSHLYLSTSDNSDPNTNRRTYRIIPR